ARDANSRAPCQFADDKAVVIETQAGAHVPVAGVKRVLNVEGRFNVPFAIGERKLEKRPRIELRGVGDPVGERLARGGKQGVDAGFPVIVPAVAGDVGAGVAFAVAAVLRNNHRSGEIVRTQGKGAVANARREAPQQVGRGDVLKVDLPAGFLAVGVLTLAGSLLDSLIG